MLRSILLLLHAIFAQVHAEEPHAKLTNEVAGKSVDLDDTSFGVLGNLAQPKLAFRVAPSVFNPSAGTIHAARSKIAAAEPNDMKKALGIRNKPTEGESFEKLKGNATSKVGFRYDKGFNRWIRDDDGGYSTEEFGDIKLADGRSYAPWPKVYLTLVDKGLKSIRGPEVLKMMENGATFVDIDRGGYSPVPNAVKIQLFRKCEGNSGYDTIRKISSFFLGQVATERNPDFDKEALEKVPKDKPVIVGCNRGGTLVDTVKKVRGGKVVAEYKDKDRAFGIESNSLKAVYEFYRLGYEDVWHLDLGTSQWLLDDLPVAENAAERVHIFFWFSPALLAMLVGCGILLLMFRFRRFHGHGLAEGQESLLANDAEKDTQTCT